MEGGSASAAPSSGTPSPGQSSITSPAKVKVNIGGIIPHPPLATVGVGGCSETANTTSMEGKRLKTDMTGDGGEDTEASGSGSGIPPVPEQLHPLQNPVILAHLFERCPLKLLAQCRLVCKQWLELSLTSWRATGILRLFHFRKEDRRNTLSKYLSFMFYPENKCGLKPHRNMRLVSWRNDLNKKERLRSFWNDLGRNLTSLEFICSEFKEADDLRRIIFGSCPNLKRLSLRNCKYLKSVRVEDFRELKYLEPPFGEHTNLRELSLEMPGYDQEVHRLPIHWLELLSHFPSLTSLKVSLTRRFLPRTEAVHEELFKAIQTIREQDTKKLNIRNFELSPPLKFLDDFGPHPDLSQFEDLGLPLHFLEIEVGSNAQSNHPLLEEDLLNRHRATLLRITVDRNQSQGYRYSRSPFSWGFPCTAALEKLEELRIHMLCTSMEFLKNTPKLKKLEFVEAPGYGHSKQEETRIFLEPDASTLVGVKLLHLTEFRMDYRVTSEDIAIFAGLMPKLRTLTMSLSDPLFSTVCGLPWGNLKELEVLGEDLTDKGVTGLDGEGNMTATANVTNLEGLEIFKFWSQELTDLSVFQGFLKLPSFKVLRVCDGIMPLGESAREAIYAKGIDFQGHYEYEWEDPGERGHNFHMFDTSVDEDEPSYDYSCL